MKGWKYNDDYVLCADCKALRPLAELAYRKFPEVDTEGRAGEHHCADAKWCDSVKPKTVQTSVQVVKP